LAVCSSWRADWCWTKIYPTLCRADCLVGQMLGTAGKFLKVYTNLETSLFLLRCLLGIRTEDNKHSKFTTNELLFINIASTSTGGRVLSVKGDLAKIQLTSPACTEVEEGLVLSRRIGNYCRLGK
ncbi:putative eukaryotic translation initiation factor 2 gamma subunit, partial [Suillus lakei]